MSLCDISTFSETLQCTQISVSLAQRYCCCWTDGKTRILPDHQRDHQHPCAAKTTFLKCQGPDNRHHRASDSAGKADIDELALCQFASQRLRLILTPIHQRRYSPVLMSLAVVWEETSPGLYQDLYQLTVLALSRIGLLSRG